MSGCCNPTGGGGPDADFYQTVLDSTGAAKPQEPALGFSADFVLTDVPGVQTHVAAPGIAAAAAAAAAAQATATAAEQPFRATYYVNPTFAGTQTGSSSNPFTTIAAAFAAGVALALAGGIVKIPPDATIVENVVFPTTGEWELAAETRYVPALVAIIQGTIDVSTTATARRALSNIQVTGAVSGNAVGGGSRMILTNCFLDGALTLTATGAAFWRCGFGVGVFDNGIVGFGGAVSGQVTVAGGIYSTGFFFGSATPLGFSQPSAFSSSTFNPSANLTSNAAGANTVTLYDCVFSGGPAINAATGTLLVQADGPTISNLMVQNATVGAGVTVHALRGNGATRQTLTNNSGAISLGRFPSSQVVINVSLTLLAVGTLAAIQASITYTDMTGAVVTQNVGGTLNGGAGGAIGDKLNASISFSQNGATAMAVQFTGVTTPGALSFQADASAQIVS